MHDFDCGTQLVIPRSFAECYTYEMQLLWLKNKIDSLEARIDELEGKEVSSDEEN
jgi:hypothetical protein